MKRTTKTTCGRCGFGLEKHRIGLHRYCLKCHAEYMRKHRRKHTALNELQRLKANARSYLNVYLKRGKIVRQPCQECGAEAQAHHEDYTKPLEVIWLCRKHHLQHHVRRTKRLPKGQA